VTRVILCDDHALIRRGIRDTLAEQPDMQIVGEAGEYGELRTLMRDTACDVLVLDINMPGRSGLDVLHALKEEGSAVRVLVVSMYPEDQYAMRALRAGAFGYVNKGGDPGQIVAAVRMVAQGRKYVTPEMAQMLVENLTTPATEAAHDKLSDDRLGQAAVRHRRGADAQPQDRERVPGPGAGKAGAGEQLGADGVRHTQRPGVNLAPFLIARGAASTSSVACKARGC
jgi:two-component system invasion response regulator UvrY